ncbi:FEKKY domain-containing protein [Dyadobacter aurulentus]|uniref:FEKKY domain-containing protein n=1 Tax=Dyadobacter sp. UC 10 TaxID=2605428 RepID=UPI0011F1248B|nr:hypothetical protein [Dyadobacter sp. UC 10]KAA0993520.1 hypothetical protein FXO21_26740 [Dyadobacter sp. UC 10]
MKKLLIINVVILAVLLIAVVAPDYYINYEVYVNLMDSLASFEWLTLLGILSGGALLSAFFAGIKPNKIPYTSRFLKINIAFNTAFLLLILYYAALAVLSAKREYEELLSEYKIKAVSDIKNGLIVYETFGFPIVLDSADRAQIAKIDSLRRSYGLESRNIGCMMTAPLLRAQSEYEKLTAPYLDRRNGPGWKQRMDTQIANIRKGQF